MATARTRRVVKRSPEVAKVVAAPALVRPLDALVPPAATHAVWPGLVSPVLDLGKATLDNLLDSAAILQGIVEETVVDTVDSTSWCPSELKQVLHETVGFLRRTRKDLRTTLDHSHTLTRAWLDRMRGAEPDPALDAGLLVN